MAPKGKAKAKCAPAAKKQKVEDEELGPDHEQESRVALQKQLLGRLNYAPQNESDEAMQARLAALEAYKKSKPAAKHNALDKFVNDKSMSWIGSWTKAVKEANATSNMSTSGWMLEDEIMTLKGVKDTHPRYKDMWDALKIDLPKRAHENPAWAAIGIEQFYYSHAHHEQHNATSTTEITNSGKGKGKGTAITMLAGPHIMMFYLFVVCCSFCIAKVIQALQLRSWSRTQSTEQQRARRQFCRQA
jgi:hypothetical protein